MEPIPPRIIHNQNNVARHLNLLKQLTNQNITDYTFEDPVYLKKPNGVPDSTLGVAEAHKNVIRKYYNEEKILIFEDDIVFTSPRSWKVFWELAEELPHFWTIYAGGCYSFNQKREFSENLDVIKGWGGAHWYLINKRAYDKVLECPENKHIDKWIGNVQTIYAPKYLLSRQMERAFEGESAKSERRGSVVNYPQIRKRHKYLKD